MEVQLISSVVFELTIPTYNASLTSSLHGTSNILKHSRNVLDFPGSWNDACYKHLGTVNDGFIDKGFQMPLQELMRIRQVWWSGKQMHWITKADPSLAKYCVQMVTFRNAEMGKCSICCYKDVSLRCPIILVTPAPWILISLYLSGDQVKGMTRCVYPLHCQTINLP